MLAGMLLNLPWNPKVKEDLPLQAFISRNEYPSSFSKEDKRSLRRRVNCFDAVDGELYYVGSTRKRQLP